ncbi:hypothetical protein [Nitrospirillum sp. BR 11828]|uniref:glycosyltransferase family 2 protein n=1 Tax=Nitrospirillum sp. BR 11828 TaxID=3104325 RepID=UPI002ACA05B1|nr:hypothetical protein [Nitrospirillum sp. BR 11828]MDZ5650714.1 hypothetical protein [Nitrospirillum sp. BR 11828]
MVERRKFDAIRGFDLGLPVAYNDVDLCMRLYKAGYYNVMCQAAELIHHESISRGLDFVSPEKMARLERERIGLYDRHPDLFLHDPFNNPNLHPNGTNFEIV